MSDLLSHALASSELDGLLDGRYQVLQILNRGAWGQTYLAQDTRRPSQPDCILQRIKRLNTHPDYQTAFRQLFVREAATLETLSEHPQIPQLLACFEDEQGFCLVQESIEGMPLSQQLNPNQPWSDDRVVQFLVDCLKPLAFVHRHCCRHGDLRPETIIYRSQTQQWVLTNFGSVREIHLSLMTLKGFSTPAIVADHGYQPPEQIRGLPCLASDIYALGLIGIQALTGLHPTQIKRNLNTGLWHSDARSRNLAQSAGLIAVLSQMVQFDCAHRYRSAADVLEALQPLIQPAVQPEVVVSSLLNDARLDLNWNDVETQTDSSLIALANSVPPTSTLVVSPATSIQEASQPNQATGLFASSAVQLGIGLGAVITTAVCGYALPRLLDHSDRGSQTLDQAAAQYQSGQFQQAIALAKSIPKSSVTYDSARSTIAHWQKDWQTAAAKYKAVEAAFNQSQWREVLQQAEGIPKIAYWQQRLAPLVLQATTKAEAESAQLLQHAYSQAIEKDFTA